MQDLTRKHSTRIIFAMVLAVLFANTLLTYLNLQRLQRNAGLVEHTHEVLLTIKSLQARIIDAETGQRGYLITGRKEYLEPYNAAVISVNDELTQLSRLVQDNSYQVERNETLQGLVQKRMTQIRNTIQTRTDKGFDEASAYVQTGEGKIAMDAIRDLLANMERQEQRLLSERISESHVSYWTALVTAALTSLLGLTMIAVGYWLVQRDALRREAIATTMAKNLEELEERVQARTTQITEANSFLRDEVIERRRAEETAQQFAAELQRSNRELEQFASVASHDLQEPLRKIQAFGDRLQSKFQSDLPAQAQDYLTRMLISATRMRNLIDDLLAYSRVTTKTQPFIRVDLREVGVEVSSDLEGRLQQTGGRIKIGEMPQIEADPVQMRQLLQNLIGNGLKFQKPNVPPVVEVSGRILPVPPSPGVIPSVGLQCEITVQDNGIGFEQVYADRIFELFQRLHSREVYEGTGMGLAICRKIVDRHGGGITVESSPGQGARFVVRLPVHQSVQGAAA